VNNTEQVVTPLADVLAFERLLAHLSTTFINLPVERVETQIERSLLQFIKLFDLDRCSLGEFTEDGTFVILHSVVVNGVGPMRREIYPPKRRWYVG
jgi:hypothetical protein